MNTVFLRVLEAEDKATALLGAVREPGKALGQQRFEVNPQRFSVIATAPFAYWASERVLDLFVRLPSLGAAGRLARTTNPTTDDFRFARAWWEVPPPTLGRRWMGWNKGGGFSPYYRDIELVVDWDETRSTYNGYLGTIYRPDVRPANLDYFFRPGLTWGYRGPRLCVQAMPAGTIISKRGHGLYATESLRAFDLGLLNSSVADSLVKLSLGRGGHPQFDVGDVSSIPVPAPDAEVGLLARRGWSLKRNLDTRDETSHVFALPALLRVSGDTLHERGREWASHVSAVEEDLAKIQVEIDERCFALYDIDQADRRAITKGFGKRDAEETSSSGASDAEDDTEEDADENEPTGDATDLAAELVSWAVGVAFGRFDVRLATGARPMPNEPEPFDPLPACSPGMLTGGNGLPLARPPAGYPLAFPEAGVLVDDLGHAQDLSTAVRSVFDAVFGAGADRWWNDVAALLDPKGHDLRVWLAGSFFEHHLKRHSKSRRKAPILWQFGTPSGRYSLWLYAHRLTRDSFFQLQNQSDGIVAQRLALEERQLTKLLQRHAGNPSAPERDKISAQEAFVEELRAMLDEIKRVAPIWNPNLDDGVVLTMAPLWRLVPQHKPWQKELKSKWDDLAARKYDWAHLAMHLWPEHVVPKCATDRSLAIAHGLEDVFWEQGSGDGVRGSGKWTPNPVPRTLISDLVRERSSPAVKDALRSLCDQAATIRVGRKR